MARSYYYKDIVNPLTGERMRLTAADQSSLGLKIQKQYNRWERDRLSNERGEKKQIALEKTEAAQASIESLNTILRATLTVNDRIDWPSLLDKTPYPRERPMPDQFQQGSFSKSFSFISAFKKRAEEQKKTEEANFQKVLGEYEAKKAAWELEQGKNNAEIMRKKLSYEKGEPEGIEDYISLVLDRSSYPDTININVEVFYDGNSQTLLVELDLPSKESLPHIQSHKYIAGRDVIEEKPINEKAFAILYNNTLYQIILRTIHEVFASEYGEFIKAVVLNGNADVRDKATGKISKKTIATIQVQRQEFLSVDLSGVDPASCFRHFKGVTAGSLVELSPVKPIMKLDRSDRRIIEASNVLEEFDPSQNLATMAWEEFEVLIRDLIQKEFSGEGAKVEVTRASRDAGVDAIAFDEDPIRGGKFVIQAKRYNNLVPLSAVRDLYGTVMNEGAVKGILVTTSYYGPDAISFVKNKPLTLINGEQLLYMFQKHGYDFKIALQSKRASSSRLI
jgi:restriction system protein